jgi:hypothetical protein
LICLLGWASGCEAPWVEPRPLEELVVRDSTYYDPETGEPFSGPVIRRFPDDPDGIQLRGTLRDGTWTGELRVYHPNGRIRFLGSFHEGRRCGEWLEEQPAEDPGSIYERLVDEIESLSVYPPCP